MSEDNIEREEAAQIAAVDARRIADRDRKRKQRAAEKLARESSAAFQKRTHEETLAEITRRQEHERRSREALIVSELTLPILPDELIEETGESYWKWFLSELEIFIDEHQRYSCGSWEKFYYRLSETEAGRRTLEFYGVPPLDLNGAVTTDHKFHLALVHQEGRWIPVFVNLTQEERDAVAALKQVWDAGRKPAMKPPALTYDKGSMRDCPSCRVPANSAWISDAIWKEYEEKKIRYMCHQCIHAERQSRAQATGFRASTKQTICDKFGRVKDRDDD